LSLRAPGVKSDPPLSNSLLRLDIETGQRPRPDRTGTILVGGQESLKYRRLSFLAQGQGIRTVLAPILGANAVPNEASGGAKAQIV
jgi:hypothetical protein